MFGNILSHISRKTLQTILLVLFAVTVLFFSLTRTQVGRDQLGKQIEKEFAERFSGSLDIGHLTGNLLNTLYASNVSIYDANGAEVIQVDSLVIQPKWTYLLRKRFSLHKLTVVRPEISLVFNEDGTTNIQRVLQQTQTDTTSTKSPWRLQSLSLDIQNGRVSSTRIGPIPQLVQNGNLFDYGNSQITDLNFRANLDFAEDSKQIDILAFAGVLGDEALAMNSGETQLVIRNNRVSINQFGLQLGASDVSLSGYFDLLGDNQQAVDLPFLIELESSSVSFSELHRVFPNLILDGEAALSSHIQGPLSDLTVSWFKVSKNASHFELAGTAEGFPDRVNLDVSLTNSTFERETLSQLLPQIEWAQFLNVDEVLLSAYLEGEFALQDQTLRDLTGRGTFDIGSNAGLVSASVFIEGSPDSLGHSISLLAEQFDLSKWTGQSKHRSFINGSAKIDGYTANTSAFFSTIKGSLNEFNWQNAQFDDISFDLDADLDHVGGDIAISNGPSLASIQGDLVLSDEPWVELTASLSNWNVGFLFEESGVNTHLNGRIEAASSLAWNSDFDGKMSVFMDSSWVIVDQDTTYSTPFTAHIDVVKPSSINNKILDFRSDFANFSIHSEATLPTLLDLGNSWQNGVKLIAKREVDKRLYPERSSDTAFPDSPLTDVLLWEKARFQFEAEGFIDPVPVEISLNLLDAARISNLSPIIPQLTGSATFQSQWLVSPDSLSWTSQIHTQDFSLNRTAFYGSQINTSFSLSRATTLPYLDLWLIDFRSDSLSMDAFEVHSTTLHSRYDHGLGELTVTSNGTKSVDSLHVDLSFFNANRSNNATISTFYVQTKNGFWSNVNPSTLQFYGDATLISDFNLVFNNYLGPTNQSFSASGAFSANPSDVISVNVNEISLRDISDFASINPQIGGKLNTQLSLSGGYDSPRITGNMDIESFSLDHRILGDIKASSSLIGGSSNIGLELDLSPLPTDRSSFIYGTNERGVKIESDLIIKGQFRIPSRLEGDSGNLDLFVDVDRAGIFFFSYIFTDAIDNVSGYLAGDGTIKGSLSNPIFDFNLGVLEGRFGVPITQSQYEIDGQVKVDKQAIHLSNIQIRDQQGGRADIAGRILFNEYRFFTLDIAGRLDELQIMNVTDSDELPFYGNLYASGDLDLSGPLYDATLFSANAVTRANSELYIPISPDLSETDESFIVFEDSLGVIPDFNQLSKRPSILASRPTAERKFLDGLNLDLSIFAPEGSTIHLVIDPLLGDVINATSTGTVQLIRGDDSFQTFGQLAVDSGDYLFTAGELFYRRFTINEGGTITWNGDPVNASLSIPASYRTRASRSGLPGSDNQNSGLIPLIVNLQISGTVTSPQVDLSLSIDRANQNVLGDYQALEAQLNQPDRATEYATSVLLTNSFQLTTENITSDSGSQLAFNSVSQLVSAQLNRFLNEALPNVDFSFGLLGENTADLDVTYGVALRLLDERLIIRGEGVYQGARAAENIRANEGLQGEFVVEIRMSPRVSVEVFFRREGDILETSGLTNTTGVGVSYQTDFDSWKTFFNRLPGSADVQPEN